MELLYVLLFVCYSSYSLNRKSVPYSIPGLKADGLGTRHAGLIISCQNIAFAISKFLAGILSDRLHPNVLFTTGLFVSGIVTISFSQSSSILYFCGFWFLNGLAQGCGWPAIAKILRERASPSQFGTLWSLLSSSNNVSGTLGPLLSTVIIVHLGWRWNVFLTGFLTVILGVVYLLSWPPLSSLEGQVKEQKSPGNEKKVPKSTIYDLLLDPFICLLSLSFLVVFCARTTTVDWGQLYLIEEKEHTQYTASAFTSSVEIGGFIGRIIAGFLSDWVIKMQPKILKKVATSPKSKLRLSVAIIFMFASILSIHLLLFSVSKHSSSVWIMCVGALMGMGFYGPIAIIGIVASESVPSHLSGSSNAIVSLFGNIGATIAGLPFSYVATYYGWSFVFLILEIMVSSILVILIFCKNLKFKVSKYDKEK